MASRFANIDEFERIKKFIRIKAQRTVTGRVTCSEHLIRPLNFADRDRLNEELKAEGIAVEWVIQS